MSPAEITAQVLRLAGRRFELPADSLRPEQDMFAALGIDSVKALELLSELEREFRVEIPDYELLDVRSFADLAGLIAERV
jgi:acyl carrier protein